MCRCCGRRHLPQPSRPWLRSVAQGRLRLRQPGRRWSAPLRCTHAVLRSSEGFASSSRAGGNIETLSALDARRRQPVDQPWRLHPRWHQSSLSPFLPNKEQQRCASFFSSRSCAFTDTHFGSRKRRASFFSLRSPLLTRTSAAANPNFRHGSPKMGPAGGGRQEGTLEGVGQENLLDKGLWTCVGFSEFGKALAKLILGFVLGGTWRRGKRGEGRGNSQKGGGRTTEKEPVSSRSRSTRR